MDPHIIDWLTKPSQVPWTENQPIWQVVYIIVFCLHTLLDCQEYNYSSWDLICPDVPKKTKSLWRSMLNIFLKWSTYMVCKPLFAGGLISMQIFKRGDFTRSQFLEGGACFWGGGVWYPDAHCDLVLVHAGTLDRTYWYERVEFWLGSFLHYNAKKKINPKSSSRFEFKC